MDDEAEHREGEGDGDSDGEGEGAVRSGLNRRRLLGVAAVAGAAAVGAAVAVTSRAPATGEGTGAFAAPSEPAPSGPAPSDADGPAPSARVPAGAPTPTDADGPAEAERRRPGSPDWRIRSVGPPDAVHGYADQVSVLPGEGFGLYVSTTAPGFRVSAYRIGWYGGAGARLVWRSDRVAGRVQRRPRLVTATQTVRADWERTTGVRTEGWPAGAYLLRLDAENGHQRYVPLIVRSASGAGRTVLTHAVATWQAYNAWGGYSLYRGKDGAYGTRSLSVTFDRPYDGNGAVKFLVYERALVVLAERLGIPLAYTTGTDIHADPSVLRGATAALSLGHDEYWTPEQRRHMTAARDAGTNLAFLGANACYRRVRLEPGDTGDGRTVVCYKSDYQNDPYLMNHRTMVTTDFRLPPAADPESALTGVFYEGYPADAPYVVHRADHWLFAGTGVKPGDSFAHLVGVEYDRVTAGVPTPRPLEIVAHSPLVCRGRRSHSDSAYYTVPSGAGVFASGTMRWVEALMAGSGENGRDHGMDARTGAFVTRTTENVLRAFAAGPAARTGPAPRDNVSTVYGHRA
ncbi:N,N-dimethylformamidase beta subunit family domain-containing protein [Streptomyces sp. NPDC051569]|uniref:N,N-dimethylformamidase beta subunit family domain-containing protein n=1 Tax=Streptomyces sp. NPDC051569 TaxID=3365661 RepID=UPI00379C365D